MKYILNPHYLMRHDKNKTYIFTLQGYNQDERIMIIHPIHAMMLSFINGRELSDSIKDIATLLQLDYHQIELQLRRLINNPTYIKWGGSTFPPNLIIRYTEGMEIRTYDPTDFIYDNIDLSFSRLSSPIDIICNLTLNCITSCIYCYAARKGNHDKHMHLELLNRILDEAHEIGVLRFKLMGGEVLLYDGWENVVTKMIKYGFQPDISTKKPITERELQKWIDIKATTDPIQFSLDTLIEDHLYKILKVKDPYIKDIKASIELFEKYGVKYVVHTVINKYNDSIDDIKSLADYFANKKHLVDWILDPAKCSMYNERPFNEYKTSENKIKAIGDYITTLNASGQLNFQVKAPNIILNPNKLSIAERKQIFESRTMCSGNMSALYILPDEKVTICEELYWHPKFIIGDLKKQSIQEIWDSDKAKELFYLKQSSIPSDSACSKCKDFSECRKYRHICWRDTILAYGANKWYYPDMTCPNAPKVERDIFL